MAFFEEGKAERTKGPGAIATHLKESAEPFYITTPIYYPSDKLHVGHAYTTVAADTMARYHRLLGKNVMFLTGMDEHGQKIQKEAEKKAVSPQLFVDGMAEGVLSLWKLLNISYDRFIRTSNPQHCEAVQVLFEKLYNNGFIYKKDYEGHYCTPCEAFWTDHQLKDGKCPDCGRATQVTKEESYFFRLSKFQQPLMDYYKSFPDFLQPNSRLKEMVSNFLEPGLDDIAVTRSSFDWGVPVPFDPKHVIYVWIDALSNYITALGYPNTDDSAFKTFWPCDVHLMAKEIVRFHAIIWPAILMALDLPLPKRVFGHGWLLMKDPKDLKGEGKKMSKSLGNVVDPVILCGRYGVDAIRYFLMREIPFGLDGQFSNQALMERINSDLANDLGNLLSRSTKMCEKYFGGILQPSKDEPLEVFDEELIEACKTMARTYTEEMNALRFSNALASIWVLVRRANKYIDETQPWILGKDESQKSRLALVLSNLLETLRQIAFAIAPFMPDSSVQILTALHQEVSEDAYLKNFAKLGDFKLFESINPIKGTQPLFPRLDIEKELEALEAFVKPQVQEKEETEVSQTISFKPACDYETFTALDLKIAKVIACEKVPKADKLLKSTVSLGSGIEKTVVSGIANYYTAEEMVGKEVLYLANLKPRKIRGVLSEGMLLCAEDKDGRLCLLRPETSVAEGSSVS